MKQRARNIIFIGHDASLSGAPILLFNLLMILKQQGDIKIFVVIRRGGIFVDEYTRYFKVLVIKPGNYGKEKNVFNRIRNAIISKVKTSYLFIKAVSADIIFSNTIINGKLLKVLSPFKKKIITYVHELENVIEQYLPSGDSALTLKLSSLFAYPSLKVKETLQNKYGILDSRLEYLPYYFPVDLKAINDTAEKSKFKNNFKRKFGITADFVVGNIGVLCKRKGTDFFIETCEKVIRQNPGIQFCWIGSFENMEVEDELRKLIGEKKLSENIILTGPLPHHYYNCCGFDLFFLSSREDPYPLVVLESALMKIPALCFRESGGITQFVEEDAGWILSGFSLNAAAETILQLYNDREQIAEKGGRALKKVLERHADSTSIANQFYEIVNQL